MRLGKRLVKLLSIIEDGAKLVIDVGTDHGYLMQNLLTSKKVEQVIATDISMQSLEKAKLLAKKYNLENQTKFVVADGLNNPMLNVKADYVVIAGMGGNEIVKILNNVQNIALYTNFILQPMQDVETLREYLLNNNFTIESDETVLDRNKFYSVMHVKVAKKSKIYKPCDIWFGKTDLVNKGEDFKMYLSYLKTKLISREKYLSQAEKEKLQACENLLTKINKGK